MKNRLIKHAIAIIGIVAFAFVAIASASKPPSTASTPAPITPAQAAYNRGEAAMKAKNYDQAITEFSEAIRLDPNYRNAYFNRGTAYEQKGDLDRAIADYTEARRLGNNSAWQSLERVEFAKQQAQRAQQQAQQKALATPAFNRGTEAYEAKNYDQAIEEFSEAITLFPNYAEAYTKRGSAYEQKRDYDRAIADFNEAVRLGDTTARQGPQRIQQAIQAAKDAAVGKGIRLGILAPEARASTPIWHICP